MLTTSIRLFWWVLQPSIRHFTVSRKELCCRRRVCSMIRSWMPGDVPRCGSIFVSSFVRSSFYRSFFVFLSVSVFNCNFRVATKIQEFASSWFLEEDFELTLGKWSLYRWSQSYCTWSTRGRLLPRFVLLEVFWFRVTAPASLILSYHHEQRPQAFCSSIRDDQCLIRFSFCSRSPGEQIEATEVFFAVTKLFQSKDIGLRRMVYLVIKEISPSSDEVLFTHLLQSLVTHQDSGWIMRGIDIWIVCGRWS